MGLYGHGTTAIMDKSQGTAPVTFIFLPLFCLVLILSLLSSSPSNVFAQHEIAPEAWIEMRKMFRDKGPAPTIEEDITALAGADAKRAGPRLIDRGPEALPAVHGAIRSTEVEPRHAQRLLQVLRSYW